MKFEKFTILITFILFIFICSPLFAQESPVTEILTEDVELEVGFNFAIEAVITDTVNGIKAAELFIDSISTNGLGIPLALTEIDSFRKNVEYSMILPTNWADQEHIFYIHGQDTLDNWGNFDSVKVYVLAMEQGESQSNLQEAFCYPNPAPTENYGNYVYFAFNLTEPADVSVEIYNSMGNVIETIGDFYRGQGRYINDPDFRWNISDIASDIYIFKIISESKITGKTDFVLKKLAIVK